MSLSKVTKYTQSQSCSETYHTSKMERFAKIVNVEKPLTIFAKRFFLMFGRFLNTPLQERLEDS